MVPGRSSTTIPRSQKKDKYHQVPKQNEEEYLKPAHTTLSTIAMPSCSSRQEFP